MKTVWRTIMIFSCLASIFLGACATTPYVSQKAEIHRQWPPLPFPARIVWVQEIKNPLDVGISKDFWKQFKEMLIGETDIQIGRPYGIFVDNSNRLFIIDSGSSLVHIMDRERKAYTVIGKGKKPVFQTPIAITGDDNDNVYITDSNAGMVFRYNLSNKTLSTFTPLDRPTGIAFNKKNRLLYITDTTSHQVVVLDLTGRVRFRIGSWGKGPGQFNYPTDLAIDDNGKLYVTDALNARIEIFSADGKFLKEFGKHGDTVGTFAKPKGVGVDSEGHIYVCDAIFDTIQIFDQSGQVLLNFGANGIEPGQLWMPAGIFIDANDYIYVADTYNRRVQVFKYIKADTSNKQVPR